MSATAPNTATITLPPGYTLESFEFLQGQAGGSLESFPFLVGALSDMVS